MTLRFILVILISARVAGAQNPDALFQGKCAGCHTAGNTVGAPLPDTLRQMSWQAILAALETGKMKAIGESLSSAERESIAKSLGIADSHPMPASAKCSAAFQHPTATGDWNGWADAANTRFQPAQQAGLTRQATQKLKRKWAFGFPAVTTAFGVPTVFDGKVFVGAADGSIYSLDARSGCVYWTYAAVAGVRVSPVIGNGAVYFGDLRGNIYALDAHTGALRWKARASACRHHRFPQTRLGTVVRSGLRKRRVARRNESQVRMLHFSRKPRCSRCSYRRTGLENISGGR